MSTFLDAVAALVPSVAVGLIFWFAMCAIIRCLLYTSPSPRD